jgi:hypothetical protein
MFWNSQQYLKDEDYWSESLQWLRLRFLHHTYKRIQVCVSFHLNLTFLVLLITRFVTWPIRSVDAQDKPGTITYMQSWFFVNYLLINHLLLYGL